MQATPLSPVAGTATLLFTDPNGGRVTASEIAHFLRTGQATASGVAYTYNRVEYGTAYSLFTHEATTAQITQSIAELMQRAPARIYLINRLQTSPSTSQP